MNRRPRYVLHPGWIRSKNDGDLHYITAEQLAHLYQVDIRKCYVQVEEIPWLRGNLVHLYPKYHGGYRLPKADDEQE